MKSFFEIRELCCEDCDNLYDHTIEEADRDTLCPSYE